MSHFVIPSQYWIEEAVEKQELIENYKKNLAEKDCRNVWKISYIDNCVTNIQ